MDALKIAGVLVEPAGGMVHQAGGVNGFEPGGDFAGVELAPAFVERHPHGNAGGVVEVLHHALQLGSEGGAVRRVGAAKAAELEGIVAVQAQKLQHKAHVAGIVQPAGGHILPDNHPQPVAVVVPAQRLHLDVLANHIAAHLASVFDIIQHGFLGGRRVEAVGEVPLVERAVEEERLAVEGEAQVTVTIRGKGELAHGKIAANFIDDGAKGVKELQGEVVEVGVSRAPGGGAGNF